MSPRTILEEEGINLTDYHDSLNMEINILVENYKKTFSYSDEQLRVPIEYLRTQFETISKFYPSIDSQRTVLDIIEDINSLAISKENNEEIKRRQALIIEKAQGSKCWDSFYDIYSIRLANEQRMKYFGPEVFPKDPDETIGYLSYIRNMSVECIPLLCNFISGKLDKIEEGSRKCLSNVEKYTSRRSFI